MLLNFFFRCPPNYLFDQFTGLCQDAGQATCMSSFVNVKSEAGKSLF